jgi:quercetin dioxygenase-like cupin family protein
MKTIRVMAVAVAVLFAGSGLAPHMAQAQQPGLKRTDLQQHDLSVPGREVVQVRVDIAPGVLAPNHSHPGKRSSMSSKVCWSTSSRANRR